MPFDYDNYMDSIFVPAYENIGPDKVIAISKSDGIILFTNNFSNVAPEWYSISFDEFEQFVINRNKKTFWQKVRERLSNIFKKGNE